MVQDNPQYKAFNALKAEGLRVYDGLDTRGREITLRFEVPCQLNNAPLFCYQSLSIGMYSYLRTGTLRHVKSIGRYCSIGPGVTIGEGEHPTSWLSTSPTQYFPEQFQWYPPEREAAPLRQVKRNKSNNDGATGEVVIGNDVWIGGGATIRRGVTIGDGAIVAGKAFVTRDVAPYSIVAGLPARHTRYRFPRRIIAQLRRLQWWQYDINDLAGVAFDDIKAAIREIERRAKAGEIAPKMPRYRTVTLHTQGYHSLLPPDAAEAPPSH